MTPRTVFNKPLSNKKRINSQFASSNGFSQPMITGMSNPVSNDNSYADKGDQYPKPCLSLFKIGGNDLQLPSGSDLNFDSDSSMVVGVVSPYLKPNQA